MRFGIFTDFHLKDGESQAQAFADGFEQVDVAEELGIGEIWLPELHFYYERSVACSPMLLGSAIANRTKNVRIGVAVQVLPLGNPVRMAEEAATLDHLCQGRLDFGVGRSNLARSYRGYGISYEESQSRFLEALDIILTAWQNDWFSYEGEYFSFDQVNVTPKPLQQPHPPLFAAIASTLSFPDMGRRGYPIFVSLRGPELAQQLETYREAWREAGHPGNGEVHLRIPGYVGETSELARSQPRESTYRGWQEMAVARAESSSSPQLVAEARETVTQDYDDMLAHRLLYGTPDEFTQRLKELEETLGLEGVVLEMNFGGQIPQDQMLNSLRLLGQEVVPRFSSE
ncbi:MAG: LLM class flavin-dependent oxidoreductase [Dehalococcoidia bacterium]